MKQELFDSKAYNALMAQNQKLRQEALRDGFTTPELSESDYSLQDFQVNLERLQENHKRWYG